MLESGTVEEVLQQPAQPLHPDAGGRGGPEASERRPESRGAGQDQAGRPGHIQVEPGAPQELQAQVAVDGPGDRQAGQPSWPGCARQRSQGGRRGPDRASTASQAGVRRSSAAGAHSPSMKGTSIRPAPCAVAIRKDHRPAGRRDARQRRADGGAGAAGRCRTPAPAAPAAEPDRRGSIALASPAPPPAPAPRPCREMAAAQRQQRWRNTAPARRSLRPLATASGQPIAGFRPWYSPSATTVSQSRGGAQAEG